MTFQSQLSQTRDPFDDQSTWSDLHVRATLQADQKTVQVQVPFPIQRERVHWQQALATWPSAYQYTLSWRVPPAKILQSGLKPHPTIANVILVSSAKGGVGKSTTAVNLALGLVQQGARVGLLDADIYGPSLPTMMGQATVPVTQDKQLMPSQFYGCAVMSIGHLLPSEDTSAVMWRGPMASRALMQLFEQTQWGALDYLIVDMPPGTGDIPLSLMKQVPIAGVVLVTTGQTVACVDTEKSLNMYQKLSIPILGLVDNMSHVNCDCGQAVRLFNHGQTQALAQRYGYPVLGRLPFQSAVQQGADRAQAAVLSTSTAAEPYHQLTQRVMRAVAHRDVDQRIRTIAMTQTTI